MIVILNLLVLTTCSLLVFFYVIFSDRFGISVRSVGSRPSLVTPILVYCTSDLRNYFYSEVSILNTNF